MPTLEDSSVRPNLATIAISDTVQNPYNSSLELALDVNEIKNFLKTNHVLKNFRRGVKEGHGLGVESLGVVLGGHKFSHKNSLVLVTYEYSGGWLRIYWIKLGTKLLSLDGYNLRVLDNFSVGTASLRKC